MHENLKHTVIKYLTKKIKKYSHFQIVTTNNIKHFFRFHINWQFRELLATNTINVFRFHIIIKQCWHFQIVTGNNTTHFSRVHIKQYWHFQRFTLSQSYYQTIVNTFFRVWMDTWTDRKFSKRKFRNENEKMLAYTHEIDNFADNYSWVYINWPLMA